MGVLFSAGNFLKESSKYFNVKDEKLTYSEIEKVDLKLTGLSY